MIEHTSVEDLPSWQNLPEKKWDESLESTSPVQMKEIHRLLSTLPERERMIVTARFGLDGEPRGQSLAEIALRMNLSKERVRQIVIRTLETLREEIAEETNEIKSFSRRREGSG